MLTFTLDHFSSDTVSSIFLILFYKNLRWNERSKSITFLTLVLSHKVTRDFVRSPRPRNMLPFCLYGVCKFVGLRQHALLLFDRRNTHTYQLPPNRYLECLHYSMLTVLATQPTKCLRVAVATAVTILLVRIIQLVAGKKSLHINQPVIVVWDGMPRVCKHQQVIAIGLSKLCLLGCSRNRLKGTPPSPAPPTNFRVF